VNVWECYYGICYLSFNQHPAIVSRTLASGCRMALASAPASDDWPTVAACGVLAATLAAILHEAVGHGLGCYADGGVVTLLTSTWFRCRGASTLTDAGGPLASLLGGAIGLALLRRRRIDGARRLTLTLFTAFSLFWFSGQLIFHAVANHDDWAIIARRLQWPSWWRPGAAALGVALYGMTIWLILRTLRGHGMLHANAIRVGYAAGACSAAIAGLMWSPMPIRSAVEGVLTLGVAPLGLLFIAAATRQHGTAQIVPVRRSAFLLVLSFVLFLAFLLTQGRGFGQLARTGFAN
jgi:hypothetical protein